MQASKLIFVAFAGLLLGATSVFAQDVEPEDADAAGVRDASPQVNLIYEREAFQYSWSNRRDPFVPLSDDADVGPRFEGLELLGVIHSSALDQSMALLRDSSDRRYRAKQGDVIGNARVVDIAPRRVVFAVDNFGAVVMSTLELNSNKTQGANR